MYEWDEEKRRTNLAKHGVDFAIVYRFEWESAGFIGSELHNHEQREIAVGLIGDMLYLMVYTERGDKCRIVSLRLATRHEAEHWLRNKT